MKTDCSRLHFGDSARFPDTPCMYINQAAARVQPVKEFASRSIEHRAEKRLNAFTVCPSWEEGREGPRRNVGPRKMHTDQVR